MEEQRDSALAERKHGCFKMIGLDYILVYPLQIRRASLVSLVALHGSRRSVRVYLVVVHTVQLCMSICVDFVEQICLRHKYKGLT